MAPPSSDDPSARGPDDPSVRGPDDASVRRPDDPSVRGPDDPSVRAERCREMARTMRQWIIERSLAANVGHVGSALSIVDMMAVLWSEFLRDAGTDHPDRDRFILAKGHAALALYCALRFKELLEQETFETYCRDGSPLGVHPEHALPGVDLSTGSLGQGLSVGCGLAYAFRTKKSPSRVCVLMSDAECNEGQVWEAAMFAGHHRLSNLIALVDVNGSQALGPTRDIIDIPSHRSLWESFGWEAIEVDGHDTEALLRSLDSTSAAALIGDGRSAERPRVIVARTVLGKGVSFMEGRFEWHYRNLTPDLAERALREIESRS